MAKERNSADRRGVDYSDVEQVPPSRNESDRAALEGALNETLNQESLQALGTESLTALTKVAQRYSGSQLTLDPIAFALVESILWNRFKRHGRPASDWHEMTREIAVILYESPASKARLVNLWNSLLGDFK